MKLNKLVTMGALVLASFAPTLFASAQTKAKTPAKQKPTTTQAAAVKTPQAQVVKTPVAPPAPKLSETDQVAADFEKGHKHFIEDDKYMPDAYLKDNNFVVFRQYLCEDTAVIMYQMNPQLINNYGGDRNGIVVQTLVRDGTVKKGKVKDFSASDEVATGVMMFSGKNTFSAMYNQTAKTISFDADYPEFFQDTVKMLHVDTTLQVEDAKDVIKAKKDILKSMSKNMERPEYPEYGDALFGAMFTKIHKPLNEGQFAGFKINVPKNDPPKVDNPLYRPKKK